MSTEGSRRSPLSGTVATSVQIHAALVRLRAIDDEPALLEAAARELCRCGFDRVMITRVTGAEGRIVVAHDSRDESNSRRVLAQARKVVLRLDAQRLEADMLRRRRPILIEQIDGDASELHPLLEMTGCRSYVAAPIAPEGRVIGLMHADTFHQRRQVDAEDRDRLMLFAEGLGYIVERRRLLERLRTLRQEVRGANAAVVAVMSESAEAKVELTPSGDSGSVAADELSMMVGHESRTGRGLTPREQEVMRLVADGLTNAVIASELVLSEQTVRTHVKRILRKLRAANRAEAVARWRSPA